tara:strand:- start:25 stop:834 length:810 start_codon:yes stop_codon:yes gene_type:complete
MNDYFPELDGNQSIDNGKMGRKLFKGGGGGQTQTTNQEIDPAILPYITYGLEEAKGLYGKEGPNYYPGETYVPASAATTSGLEAAQARATSGSPLLPAAQNQLQSTIQGDYLSAGNPYFSGMLAAAADPLKSQFQSTIRDIGGRTAASGRYGSGAMGEMESNASKNLANAMTNEASKLAFANYQNERGAQQNAIAAAPGMAQADYQDIQQLMNVGQTQEDYANMALQDDIGRYEFEQNAPYSKLQNYLSAAYGAPTPMNQTTTSSGGGK